MNSRIDELAKRLSGGASRRQTLQGLGALALGSLAVFGANDRTEARRNNRRCNNCKHKCKRDNRRKNNNNNKKNCGNKCRNKCRN